MNDYSTTGYETGPSPAFTIFFLLFLLACVIALWKLFQKAGRPGWAAVVPFYNVYVMLKMVGRPGWWLLLFLIPLVNIVIAFIVAIDLAKSFGQSTLFGIVGLFLFQPIGYLILGFGKAEYLGPSAQSTQPPTPQTPPPASPSQPPV